MQGALFGLLGPQQSRQAAARMSALGLNYQVSQQRADLLRAKCGEGLPGQADLKCAKALDVEQCHEKK